jgi:hypothetical protein
VAPCRARFGIITDSNMAFEYMDGRKVKIDDADEGTCQWLLKDKTLIE